MKKIISLITLLLAFLSGPIIAQNDCSFPFPFYTAFGLASENDVSNPLNCGTNTAVFVFEMGAIQAFNVNLIFENVSTGIRTSTTISGTYDSDYEGTELAYLYKGFFTVTNGHLVKIYMEYSTSEYYCLKYIQSVAISECSDTDEDGDGFAADVDCNDNSSADFPFGAEYCDGYDNNCNGLVDDADPDIAGQPYWLLDEDGDGFPLSNSGIPSCFQPDENYIIQPYSGSYDCDDTNPDINPDTVLYQDYDDDGYAGTTSTIGVRGCNPDESWTTNVLPLGDCDDTNSNINPGKTEIPFNGIDDDCNPTTADINQYFSIPDPNFEQALIDLGIDTDGLLNNQVLVADLITVTQLDLSYPETNSNLPNVNGKINDLSGIQLFYNLIELNIAGNNITNLSDLTGSNTNNRPTNAEVQTDAIITTLNVLNCSANNLISLDVSNMSALNSLNCSSNQLENLNVKNGINTAFLLFNAINNSSLNCINVDNATYSTTNWQNIDTQASFSEDCANTLTVLTPEILSKKIKVYPNPVSKILNIVSDKATTIKSMVLYTILGQPIHQPIAYRINVSSYSAGIYLLKIETDQGSITKKIIIKN